MQNPLPDNFRSMDALLSIMARLRDPDNGCPWDVEQNFRTIAPYTIEEAYEVADAIERGDLKDLKDELGDLLLQVVFHAQMAAEENVFTFADIVESICDKMVRRHPHVFGDGDARTSDEQTNAWEEQKARERAAKADGAPQSLLADVPAALPAATRAVKLQKRAARVGFDWTNTEDILGKVEEEARELTVAAASKDADAVEDEFGDLLFVMANLARRLDVDPEAALRRTNEKFIRRFQWMEAEARREGFALDEKSLDELEEMWQAAKAALAEK